MNLGTPVLNEPTFSFKFLTHGVFDSYLFTFSTCSLIVVALRAMQILSVGRGLSKLNLLPLIELD
jgi:hypothetical protein